MGSKRVKTQENRFCQDFVKNESNDLVHSPSESRYYESTYVCQFSSPGKFLFPRYGV